MRYLFGSNLSKLFVLVLIMLAACSIACAEDLSGQWDMVANTNYHFKLDLQQSGNQITGTMTSKDDASLLVETISGTISEGTIQFIRELAGQQTQVYTGSLSGSSITGAFNQNGQGQYPWSASKASETKQAETAQLPYPSDLSDLVTLEDLSGLNTRVTDKNYDTALAINDKILAISLDPGKIVQNPPDSLDYSQYTTMTENQDGFGGCGGRSLLHAINIIKEMEHPYTPDLSFWYIDARQSELIKSGIQDNPTKTLVEKYGICTEASFPSDYDTAKLEPLVDDPGNRDYSAMPQITDAINQEAGLYKLKTLSEPVQSTVESIKSLLIKYGPVWCAGPMPLGAGQGHWVTVVGYDDGIQAFKCLNSLGDTWNGNGYFYIPYEKLAENSDTVRYLENLFSDRSSTEHAFTARINVTAQKRNQLTIKVGADVVKVGEEEHEAKTVWDTPCQVECIDNSKTICIDVPLPSYASSAWPPAPNQWYVEITNTGLGSAKVNEVTLARLINEKSCLSVGKFRTETYVAESLPVVKSGDTVKVYVKGEMTAPIATISEWYSLKFYQSDSNMLSGSLDVNYPLGGSATVADKEVRIYKKSQPSCLNMPPKWTPVGSVVTGSDGSFTFEEPKVGVYAASILDSSGNVEASSSEASLGELVINPVLTYDPKEISDVVVKPVDELAVNPVYDQRQVSPEVKAMAIS